tara:strand:- start:401 stop:514 length:114 start_codon:yes stop_codon:yes gene_type:complete
MWDEDIASIFHTKSTALKVGFEYLFTVIPGTANPIWR